MKTDNYSNYKKTGLTEALIPDGTSHIGKYCFCGCSSLKKAEIPDSVQDIGCYAFYKCVELKGISLPAGLKEIKDETFYGCTDLSYVLLPEGLQRIGNSAFYGCSELDTVFIPDGVHSIGNAAFSDCTKLKMINIPDSVSFIGLIAFDGCPDIVIHANAGSYAEKYAQAHKIPFADSKEGNFVRIIKKSGDCTDIFMEESTQLKAVVLPEQEDMQPLVWESCNSDVASVDSEGGVTALSYGTATIKVSLNDGSCSEEFKVRTRFKDVAGSNIKGSRNYQYFYDPVYWAADKGLIDTDNACFMPDDACTYKDALRMLYKLDKQNEEEKTVNGDTGKLLVWAEEKELTGKDPALSLDEPIKRIQFILMLYRYKGRPEAEGDMPFSDINAEMDDEVINAALWSFNNGIAYGSKGKFGIDEVCLRKEAVTFVFRAFS